MKVCSGNKNKTGLSAVVIWGVGLDRLDAETVRSNPA
jgi:hypothetical protein